MGLAWFALEMRTREREAGRDGSERWTRRVRVRFSCG